MGLWMSRLLSLFGDREARILVLGLDNAGKTTILCECGEGERQTRAHAHFGLDTHPLFFSLTPLTYAQNSHTHTHTDRLQVGEVVSTIPSECCADARGCAGVTRRVERKGETNPAPRATLPLSPLYFQAKLTLPPPLLSSPLLSTFSSAIGFNVETVTYKNIKFQVWDLGGQTSIRPYWRCYYPNTQAVIYVVDAADPARLATAAAEFHAILEEDELKGAAILVYANKQDLPGALGDAEVAEGLGLAAIKARDWAIFRASAVKGEGLFEGLDWLSAILKARPR